MGRRGSKITKGEVIQPLAHRKPLHDSPEVELINLYLNHLDLQTTKWYKLAQDAHRMATDIASSSKDSKVSLTEISQQSEAMIKKHEEFGSMCYRNIGTIVKKRELVEKNNRLLRIDLRGKKNGDWKTVDNLVEILYLDWELSRRVTQEARAAAEDSVDEDTDENDGKNGAEENIGSDVESREELRDIKEEKKDVDFDDILVTPLHSSVAQVEQGLDIPHSSNEILGVMTSKITVKEVDSVSDQDIKPDSPQPSNSPISARAPQVQKGLDTERREESCIHATTNKQTAEDEEKDNSNGEVASSSGNIEEWLKDVEASEERECGHYREVTPSMGDEDSIPRFDGSLLFLAIWMVFVWFFIDC